MSTELCGAPAGAATCSVIFCGAVGDGVALTGAVASREECGETPLAPCVDVSAVAVVTTCPANPTALAAIVCEASAKVIPLPEPFPARAPCVPEFVVSPAVDPPNVEPPDVEPPNVEPPDEESLPDENAFEEELLEDNALCAATGEIASRFGCPAWAVADFWVSWAPNAKGPVGSAA